MPKGKDYESPIGKFRIAKGLHVKELCKKIGINQSVYGTLQNGMITPFYLWKWKYGEIKPYVYKLCRVLGATLSELFPRYICDIDRFEKWNEESYWAGDKIEQILESCHGQHTLEYSKGPYWHLERREYLEELNKEVEDDGEESGARQSRTGETQ